MAHNKKNGNGAPVTTSQALGSLLKTARAIMRKDKGLNGDLDRLPLLTWIMFLKFLDDLEQQREQESKLSGKKFRAAIEAPYRWRDWAANPQGITGDELLSFINQDETRLPTGKRGAGLFAYLRALSSANGDNRRDVISIVFRGVDNRMKSGYLLRDVINKVADIHFTSSDELHTLGALYETMLREMRDAAGDSGEFYTPRPVVRFMVEVTDPRLGETLLDPASGTGGFLVEAFNHLSQQVKTVGDRRRLQAESLFGCEPKSLPYLLGQMNLLLHGLDAPQIDPGNALRFKLSEIGEKDRVDVILTNPPFGGEEEKGIQGNFPEDRQTAETALLFLQLIMRKLRRKPTPVGRPARAAVVVPNGTLFGDGACARIKEELLKEFNLHTVVRLPEGVFAPYTPIPTNILFFDRSGPTKEVWYYEHPLPDGRKNYTKTLPLQFDEFQPCLAWWRDRVEGAQAWKVTAKELLDTGCNLDRKNPRGKVDFEHMPPEQLADDILQKELQIAELMQEIRTELGCRASAISVSSAHLSSSSKSAEPLSHYIELYEEVTPIQIGKPYPQAGVRGFGSGLFPKPPVIGGMTTYRTFNALYKGSLVMSQVKGWEGAIAVTPDDLVGYYVSPEYRTFRCKEGRCLPEYLAILVSTEYFWGRLNKATRGVGARRQRTRPEQFLALNFSMPSVEDQQRAIAIFRRMRAVQRLQSEATKSLNAMLPSILEKTL